MKASCDIFRLKSLINIDLIFIGLSTKYKLLPEYLKVGLLKFSFYNLLFIGMWLKKDRTLNQYKTI